MDERGDDRLDFTRTLSALQGLIGQPVAVLIQAGAIPISLQFGTLRRMVEGDAPWAAVTRGSDLGEVVTFAVMRNGTRAAFIALTETSFGSATEHEGAVQIRLLEDLGEHLGLGTRNPILTITIGPTEEELG
jgi:hypothetical protein